MFKVVSLQCLALIAAALIAAVFFGARGAISAAGAAVACIVPYWLFASLLRASTQGAAGPSVGVFVMGEFIKLTSIIGLLVLLVLLYPPLHWGSLLIGLILVLKANLFAFLLKT